jgi:SAM-dependent methyltransferase
MLYLLPVLAGLVALVFVAREYQRSRDLVSRRNFYGVLRVVEYDWLTEDARRNLYNGRILHGVQFTEPDRRREPTTYYNPASGIGITLENLADIEPLHVATVGLGTGTIAAYAQEGDRYCFYEINPDVLDIAQHYFTFLSDAPSMPRLVLGDARLSMEQETPQDYDVIALDAFSGDAIPTHLLTVEAVAVYLKHLKPSGVLAVHTSNRHLDLVPIVALLGAHYGLDVVVVEAEDEEGVADSGSEWLLVTRNRDFLQLPSVASASSPVTPPGPEIRVWTDQYSNLFQIMRALQKNEEEEAE